MKYPGKNPPAGTCACCQATRALVTALLAHEINQPLTTILVNAQAARRFIQQGESRPDELLAILDDIIHDNKRACEVVRSLPVMPADTPAAREPHALLGTAFEARS